MVMENTRTVRIVNLQSKVERAVLWLGNIGTRVRLQFCKLDSGIEFSLSNGRMIGAKGRNKWKIHDDDLAALRTEQRAHGVKIRPSGVGSYLPRPRKPKPGDPRQVSMFDE